MPDPKKYEDKQKFMEDCMHENMKEEGKPQDQSVAVCLNMWNDRNKKKACISTSLKKLASVLALDALKAKDSKWPVLFLGGECRDNKWRKEIEKEYGKKFFILNPYDKTWKAEDNIYDELAGIVNADYVVFLKGGDGTKKEQAFLDAIGKEKEYRTFENIGSLKKYLSNIDLQKKASCVIKNAKKGASYEYASTQVDLPENLAEQAIFWCKNKIPDDELYEEIGECKYGREDEIHITLLYGLKTKDPAEVKKLLNGVRPFKVKLLTITAFKDNKDYDVLKIDVECPEMFRMHYMLEKNLPNDNSFPTYHPHCTLAYLKKGYADKYIGNQFFSDISFIASKIVYSSQDNKKTDLFLGDLNVEAL